MLTLMLVGLVAGAGYAAVRVGRAVAARPGLAVGAAKVLWRLARK